MSLESGFGSVFNSKKTIKEEPYKAEEDKVVGELLDLNEKETLIEGKIEIAEKKTETEQESLMKELSQKEVSLFQETKEKIKRGCKIGIVSTMIITSLLAAGCGAEKPKKVNHWSQTNIEEARKAVPEDVTEGWVQHGLQSIGSWKEDEGSFLVRTNKDEYYRITQENLEEFKERMSNYINQYLYYSIEKAGRDRELTGKLLDVEIKSWFDKYVEEAVERERETIAYGLFEKAFSSEWQKLKDHVYFGVEQSDKNQEKKDEVIQSPDLTDLDPTLK
ncbi:MAG TPA: hypothetical protein VFD40_01670 [Candidatus Paceibacterota bacterium]|nr:hypothetical protein [Candidatus Paceibacterota bacterium]